MTATAKYPHLIVSGPQGLLTCRRVVLRLLQHLIGKQQIVVTFGSSDLTAVLPRYREVSHQIEEQHRKPE